MAVVYSTSDVHPRDSADYWRDVVTRDFVKIVMTRDPGTAFRASVRSGNGGQPRRFGLRGRSPFIRSHGTRHLAHR